MSLLDFLSAHGLRDDGGERRARDAELWHRERPFRRRLVREDGVSLEHAASLAWEAGYFPDAAAPAMDSADNMQPVTADMLLAEIDRDLAGDEFDRLFNRPSVRYPDTMDRPKHASELVEHFGLSLFGEEWGAAMSRLTGVNQRTMSRIRAASREGVEYPAAKGVLAGLHQALGPIVAELKPHAR